MEISLHKAFTLVEMLIVIVIIGILAAALIPRLTGIQARARDTARLTDIRNIQKALDLYYFDYGKYPRSDGAVGCATYTTIPNSNRCNSLELNTNGRWIANGALAPYITNDPVDPKPDSLTNITTDNYNSMNKDGGAYYYLSHTANPYKGCTSGQFYILIAGMEVIKNRILGSDFKMCDGSSMGNIYGGSYYVGRTNGPL